MAKKTKAVKKVNSSDVKEFNLIDEKIIDDSGVGTEPTPELIKTKRLTHFDIFDYMFTDIEKFQNLTDYVFEQNFFMLNRTISIKYPRQAQFFNKLGINAAAATKFWQYFLNAKEGYGRKPQFLFTKGAKKSSDEQAKTRSDKFDKKLIEEYCRHYHLSLKDFKDMLQFFNEETVEDVLRFEKIHSKSEQAKMFKSGKSTADIED